MSLPRGGLWPVRHQSGEASFQTQREKKETGENDASLVYVGDAVRIVSGKAIRYTAGDVSGGVAPPVFGVVARVLRDEAGRPRVHGLPDQHPNISLTGDAAALVYTGSSYADLTRGDRAYTGEQPSYTIVDLPFGVARGSYSIDFFLKNAFDERARTTTSVACTTSICGVNPYYFPNMPRTFGVKFSQEF